MTTVRAARPGPRPASLAPAPPLTAVFERLPLTTMPLDRPGAEVGGAEAEQLPVGVDLVVAPGPRRSWPRPRPSAKPTSMTPAAAAARRQVVAEAEPPAARATAARCRSGRRSPRRGRPGRTAARPRSPKSDGDQRAGHHRGEAPQPEHDGQRGQRRRASVRPLRVAEVGEHAPELLEEVALGLLDAEQLRAPGPMMIVRAEADDEALEHGLGDEVGQEAEPQQPGGEGETPGGDGQRGRERDGRRPCRSVARSATAAADRAAVADIGPTTGAASCRRRRRGAAPAGRRRGRPPATRRRSRRRRGPRERAPPTRSARRRRRPGASARS